MSALSRRSASASIKLHVGSERLHGGYRRGGRTVADVVAAQVAGDPLRAANVVECDFKVEAPPELLPQGTPDGRQIVAAHRDIAYDRAAVQRNEQPGGRGQRLGVGQHEAVDAQLVWPRHTERAPRGQRAQRSRRIERQRPLGVRWRITRIDGQL